jgi:hypothetical protein
MPNIVISAVPIIVITLNSAAPERDELDAALVQL